jgi:branched-chain amino acid transport system permease protein
VVLGGQGNKLGVILGAFIIVYLPNFFLGRTDLFGIPINGDEIAKFKYLFFGLALVVLMIFRPQGLFPARQKLLTYSREVYVAARKAALTVSGHAGHTGSAGSAGNAGSAGHTEPVEPTTGGAP